MNKTKKYDTRKLVFMALICALAYIFTLVFHIKVSFLTFDLKNTILAVGALIFGPVSSLVTSLAVSVLEMITISDTGIWGCIMNFVSSAVYAFTVGIIYKYNRTLWGALLGLVSASIALTAVMIPLNLLITPIYTGAPLSAIVDMIIPLLLPFNAIKAVICSAVTLLIYKPVRTAFKAAGLNFSSDSSFAVNKKYVIISVCSLIIIALGIFIFFAYFDGSFELYTK